MFTIRGFRSPSPLGTNIKSKSDEYSVHASVETRHGVLLRTQSWAAQTGKSRQMRGHILTDQSRAELLSKVPASTRGRHSIKGAVQRQPFLFAVMPSPSGRCMRPPTLVVLERASPTQRIANGVFQDRHIILLLRRFTRLGASTESKTGIVNGGFQDQHMILLLSKFTRVGVSKRSKTGIGEHLQSNAGLIHSTMQFYAPTLSVTRQVPCNASRGYVVPAVTRPQRRAYVKDIDEH